MSIFDQMVKLTDFSSGLADIKREIEEVLPLIEKAEQSGSINDHAKAALALSGLEVKMSNFADDLRTRFLQ